MNTDDNHTTASTGPCSTTQWCQAPGCRQPATRQMIRPYGDVDRLCSLHMLAYQAAIGGLARDWIRATTAGSGSQGCDTPGSHRVPPVWWSRAVTVGGTILLTVVLVLTVLNVARPVAAVLALFTAGGLICQNAWADGHRVTALAVAVATLSATIAGAGVLFGLWLAAY